VYGGRHMCDSGNPNNPQYMSMLTESTETIVDLPNSPQDLLFHRTYNVRCLDCLQPTVASNTYYVPNTCGGRWERSSGKYSYVSQGYEYATCGEPRCNPGEYGNCPHLNCPKCDCGTACSGDMYYCLVNTTLCNGHMFESMGGTCKAVEAFRFCDIGSVMDHVKYFQSKGVDDVQIYTDILDSQNKLKYDLCSECQHPGAVKVSVGIYEWTFCGDGFFWPGCTSVGVMMLPPCEACRNETKPGNSVWAVRGPQQTFPECTWECAKDFYRNNSMCVSCTELPCRTNMYRQACRQGTIALPACVACAQRQGPGCETGYYERQCDGTGYWNIGDTRTLCTRCRTESEMNCTAAAPYKTCTRNSFSDNSVCEPCATFDSQTPQDNTGNLPYTGDCVFDCNVGYYREQRKLNVGVDDGKNVYRCVPCETDANNVCTSCNYVQSDVCSRQYEVDACDTIQRVDAPPCQCKPGHGYSGPPAGPVLCTECEAFMISEGNHASCRHCDGGYSGATEVGSSTCLACPVDTFRPYRDARGNMNDHKCKPCPAGTNGLTASKTCISCNNGMMAIRVDWEGYLWNYQNSSWTHWKGFPPNQCVVRDMGPDIKICNTTGARTDIRYVIEPGDKTEYLVDSIEVEFVCGECSGGLAFSSNFDYMTAIHSEL
jgi:hypothetical protein